MAALLDRSEADGIGGASLRRKLGGIRGAKKYN
jgi:hypothetical protein